MAAPAPWNTNFLGRPLAAAFLTLALIALPALGQPGATDPELATLHDELRVIAAASGGKLGVAIRHIESGREVFFQADNRYPMGSTFKLPLAIELLRRVDAGTLSLDKSIVVQANDLRPGSGKIAHAFGEPRGKTVRELLEAMMIHSDNTATDILWREVGGAKPIMERLQTLGVDGISVSRPTGPLLAASHGLGLLPSGVSLTPARHEEIAATLSKSERAANRRAFLKSDLDTATPAAFVDLLQKFWLGQTLSEKSTALLIALMLRCETGKGRIRAGVPRGTKVAHKTGTLQPFATNDVGIVYLPGRSGHLIVAVFLRESTKTDAEEERVIAAVAKAAYAVFAANAR